MLLSKIKDQENSKPATGTTQYVHVHVHCNTNESRSTHLLKNDFVLNKFFRPLALSQHVFDVLAKAYLTNVLHSSSYL